MVSTLLHFISCTRRLDWEGHLNTLEKIIPWLLAYDHVSYFRYVPVYLHEMHEFKKHTHFLMSIFVLVNLLFSNKIGTDFSQQLRIK